jgi:hypothetical protein
MSFRSLTFNGIARYWSLLCQLRFDSSINDIVNCDILFYCHDVDRGADLNGMAYAPLIDSLVEDFIDRGYRCASIAKPFSKYTGNKAYGSPHAINRHYLIAFMLDSLSLVWGGRSIRYRTRLYKNILKKSRAKLLVSIGADDALCLAAHEERVLLCELLHGIGYNFIPWGWQEKPAQLLPDVILSLDAVSTEAFRSLADRGVAVHTIPHPFARRFRAGSEAFLPESWKPNLSHMSQGRKHVLISLIWGYAGDHGKHVQFANLLSNGLFYDELKIAIEETRDSVFWHFRFHPVQYRQAHYEHLRVFMDEFVRQHPNTEWEEASRLPFLSIASKCSGNISMSSMSCYDAAYVGVPSLMLCPTLRPGGIYEDLFDDLERESYVTKASASVEIIKSWVAKVERKEPRLSNLMDAFAWEEAIDWLVVKSGLKKNNPRINQAAT